MLYPSGSVFSSMTHVSIYTFTYLNVIFSFKKAREHTYPPTVTDSLKTVLNPI